MAGPSESPLMRQTGASTISPKPRYTLSVMVASNEAAFQGIEKAMFYRICRLLTLNIQLIFVFDGPGRPWKRGKRGGGKIDFEKRRLLQQMLTCFGIPYHEAPGEAEAECARLQILGIVDAVWSQDSDCLMFGCTLWIHDDRVAKEKGNTDRSKENTKKNNKFVRVVESRQMEEKFGLDREGLVLFAMLSGGDYQTSGLPGCGTATAMHAVKMGLGRALCSCRNQRDCSVWSAQLAEFLRTTPRAKHIFVPANFPDFKILQKYYNPKVSSDEVLRSSSRLNLGYERPIQELKLLEVTSSRFNIWGRRYMDWVGPVLLTKHMSQRNPALPREVIHNIKLTKRRVKKDNDQPATRSFERKLTFSPFGVTSLGRADFEGDRLGYWNGDRASLFDPEYRVECEIPDYWLQKALPHDVLDPPPAVPNRRTPKRRQQTDGDAQANETPIATKRRRKHNGDDQVTSQVLPSACSSNSLKDMPHSQASTTPSRPGNQQSTVREKILIELSDSEDDNALRLPNRVRSQNPTSIRSAISQIVDLGSPEPSEDEENWSIYDHGNKNTPFSAPILVETSLAETVEKEDRDLQLALRLSMQKQQMSPFSSLSHDVLDGTYAREVSRSAANSLMHSESPSLMSLPTNSASMPAGSSQQIRKVLPHEPGSSEKSTVHNIMALAPADSSHWTLNSPTIPTMLASTSSTPASIRAARLRHFAANSDMTTTTQMAIASPPPKPTPSKLSEAAFHVPAGANCIDLTGD
ncbi:uncharacterized protein K460DRAFT_352184 [Cucurbitaria berberidis CBS 394.84]|uniref:XPG-I domain-containing protein n=1 Tax=Cucurbitaria berberidis CBS 394.84 TaxID=1168544 RepID=A0A9P4GIV6_9PLEO|nr:uncharacterized protein K460DRAFT_352184 [Cucurbitaria berberidis CBS 394.84]KAF1846993.1 hypothetical protein K460DRAFT_352184 [Cucurbitaria berberidis CBS 394.84]